MVSAVSQEEVAAFVIAPHFRAVQDIFSVFETEPGHPLAKLAKVKFIIDPEIHDKPRHFAATEVSAAKTRDDGMLMLFAPEIIELPVETLVAIISHEFGHAADFAYASRWVMRPDGPGVATWIDSEDLDTKEFRAWSKLWNERSADQIEWAADGIAEAVTGQKLTYCGDCMLQCFGGGVERPKGLR